MPVDMIMGFPVRAMYSTSGTSHISNDATLYAGTFIVSRKSTAVKSNGDEKRSIPSRLAISFSFGCHSHGVYASPYS